MLYDNKFRKYVIEGKEMGHIFKEIETEIQQTKITASRRHSIIP
jgi:hypothetical protein